MACFVLNNLKCKNFFFEAPLDYSHKLSGRIRLFARVVSLDNATCTRENSSRLQEKTCKVLCYLQGGPGFEAPRPDAISFLRPLVEVYDEVVLLEQRGTGLSSAIDADSLLEYSSDVGQQKEYLRCFRADSIVRDAELCRTELYGAGFSWSILGQSFGGFCAVTYLSFFPNSLKECYITGGIPPIISGFAAKAVYKSLFQRLCRQNEKYYQYFPEDVSVVWEIVEFLLSQLNGCVTLPSGSVLTPQGLQTLGFRALGFSGGFGFLHLLLERAFREDPTGKKNYLAIFYAKLITFSPLLNEIPYMQLYMRLYTVMDPKIKRVLSLTLKSRQPIYFTGEMIFPWMFDEFSGLRPFKEVAQVLAEEQNWSELYDRDTLRQNKVLTAAAVYVNDVYVDSGFSLETAKDINNIRLWITNEYLHGALREDTRKVLQILQKLVLECSTCLEL
eukprot:jgi/Galph1/2858/GphlegSOOS_G1508.1